MEYSHKAQEDPLSTHLSIQHHEALLVLVIIVFIGILHMIT
jgi:hypothetical protein